MKITITYDNIVYKTGLSANHGFSCVIRYSNRTILFDTGSDGEILLDNMGKLGISPGEIDTVFLSHIHGDHIGGLASFLDRHSAITVYLPASFPESIKNRFKVSGARIEGVAYGGEILPGIFTTGELGEGIKEQSLIAKPPSGLVVITGCAHTGILNIIRKAMDITGDRVHLVLGGFHLLSMPTPAVEAVIEEFVALGVEKVSPCHCSGDKAQGIFNKRFGRNCINGGVGREIFIGE